jgi:hypothetical protein
MSENKNMPQNPKQDGQNTKPQRIYTAKEVYTTIFWGLLGIIVVLSIVSYIIFRICKYVYETYIAES